MKKRFHRQNKNFFQKSFSIALFFFFRYSSWKQNLMKSLKEILKQIQNSQISIEEAENLIKIDYLDKIDNFAQIDMFRHNRTGIPEVIFAESKSDDLIVSIIESMLSKNNYAILTRLTESQFIILDTKYKENNSIHYAPNYVSKTAFISGIDYEIPHLKGTIGLITAGTSDIPIAEEANVVLTAMGFHTITVFDVGIAGMHRIFPPLKQMILDDVDVILVFAGMEGTLPGVISSLVDIPVIGIPTSIGYGIGEKGRGALTTMLQSCSPGLSVVNIDNGFGAASMAALIVKKIYKTKNY